MQSVGPTTKLAGRFIFPAPFPSCRASGPREIFNKVRAEFIALFICRTFYAHPPPGQSEFSIGYAGNNTLRIQRRRSFFSPAALISFFQKIYVFSFFLSLSLENNPLFRVKKKVMVENFGTLYFSEPCIHVWCLKETRDAKKNITKQV